MAKAEGEDLYQLSGFVYFHGTLCASQNLNRFAVACPALKRFKRAKLNFPLTVKTWPVLGGQTFEAFDSVATGEKGGVAAGRGAGVCGPSPVPQGRALQA